MDVDETYHVRNQEDDIARSRQSSDHRSPAQTVRSKFILPASLYSAAYCPFARLTDTRTQKVVSKSRISKHEVTPIDSSWRIPFPYVLPSPLHQSTEPIRQASIPWPVDASSPVTYANMLDTKITFRRDGDEVRVDPGDVKVLAMKEVSLPFLSLFSVRVGADTLVRLKASNGRIIYLDGTLKY